MKTIDIQIRYFSKEQRSRGPQLICSAALGDRRALLIAEVHHKEAATASLIGWEEWRRGVHCGWHPAHGDTAKDHPWYTAKLRNAVARHAGSFYQHWARSGPIGVLHARLALASKELDLAEGYYRRALIAFGKDHLDAHLLHVERERETARDRRDVASTGYYDAAYLCPNAFTWKVDRWYHNDSEDDDMALVTDDVFPVKS